MIGLHQPRGLTALALFGLLLLATSWSNEAAATGNVAMALDGMIVNNTGGGQTGWGGFGRFTYGVTVGPSATLGRYGAFTLSEPGTGGGGVGVNFALGSPAIDSPRDSFSGPITPVTAGMFPLLDRATFGVNFDPSQYVAELVYKPLPGNTATQLNMTVDTTDGFNASGGRAGEQWQWGFTDLLTQYSAAQLDADGFATVRNNGGAMTQAASFFHGQSFMYQSGNPVGDDEPDFNDFEGGPLPVPNGAVQLHLQAVFGGTQQALVDNWEIKAVRIVKLAPDPTEVARLDGRSGFSLRFGTPFQRNPDTLINVGGVDYDPPVTDQASRFDQNGFTNIVLNTDDSNNFGGLALWQSAASTVFDGTQANVEVKARLTAPLGAGQADHIVLIVKDKDGNGLGAAGDGGDEYRFNLQLNQFNTGGMTTVSIPLNTFTAQVAQEFANAGDGQLTNFNLYYLGLQTDQNAGLVDLEIESIRVLVPAPSLAGDYDDDNDVDGNDFLVWQRTLGSTVTQGSGADGNNSGTIDAGDLTVWRTNFGMTIPATMAAASVPEPAAISLLGFAALGLLWRRRGR